MRLSDFTLFKSLDILGEIRFQHYVKIMATPRIVPKTGDRVDISYTSYRASSGLLIEEDVRTSFVIGQDHSINALEECVRHMTDREVAIVISSPDQAYGCEGWPPHYAPHQGLIFKVKLLSHCNFNHKEEMDFRNRLSYANTLWERGNFLCARKEYERATEIYSYAIVYLVDYEPAEELTKSETKSWENLYIKLCSTIMRLFYKAKSFRRSLTSAQMILKLDSKNTKAMYFKGRCIAALGHPQEAIKVLKEALYIDPTDKAIKIFIKAIREGSIPSYASDMETGTGQGEAGHGQDATASGDTKVKNYDAIVMSFRKVTHGQRYSKCRYHMHEDLIAHFEKKELNLQDTLKRDQVFLEIVAGGVTSESISTTIKLKEHVIEDLKSYWQFRANIEETEDNMKFVLLELKMYFTEKETQRLKNIKSQVRVELQLYMEMKEKVKGFYELLNGTLKCLKANFGKMVPDEYKMEHMKRKDPYSRYCIKFQGEKARWKMEIMASLSVEMIECKKRMDLINNKVAMHIELKRVVKETSFRKLEKKVKDIKKKMHEELLSIVPDITVKMETQRVNDMKKLLHQELLSSIPDIMIKMEEQRINETKKLLQQELLSTVPDMIKKEEKRINAMKKSSHQELLSTLPERVNTMENKKVDCQDIDTEPVSARVELEETKPKEIVLDIQLHLASVGDENSEANYDQINEDLKNISSRVTGEVTLQDDPSEVDTCSEFDSIIDEEADYHQHTDIDFPAYEVKRKTPNCGCFGGLARRIRKFFSRFRRRR